MGLILPIASGKGGVGKSALAASLGAALARRGRSVILVDLDLGASNLHTILGIRNPGAGLGDFIAKKADTLESVVFETEIPMLSFIPGDSFLPGTANLNYFMKLKIMKALEELSADFIILDLGAGTAFNVIDFFCLTNSGLIVTIPETTAILNAYSFLKFTLFRMISRQFPAKGEERKEIAAFLSDKIEGTDRSFSSLRDLLSPYGEEAMAVIDRTIQGFTPRIIINRGTTSRDIDVGQKLRQIISRNLNIQVHFIGLIPESPQVVPSIFKGIPASVLYPDSPFSRAIFQLADKIKSFPSHSTPFPYFDDEDLDTLQSDYHRATALDG